MIDHMPRPRLPYLQRETDRHGNVRWYVRTSRQSPRVRIESPYGSPGFMEEYRAALDGQKIIREKGKLRHGIRAAGQVRLAHKHPERRLHDGGRPRENGPLAGTKNERLFPHSKSSEGIWGKNQTKTMMEFRHASPVSPTKKPGNKGFFALFLPHYPH